MERAKEEAPPTPGRNEEEEKLEVEDEELDLTEMRDEDSGEEKNGARYSVFSSVCEDFLYRDMPLLQKHTHLV